MNYIKVLFAAVSILAANSFSPMMARADLLRFGLACTATREINGLLAIINSSIPKIDPNSTQDLSRTRVFARQLSITPARHVSVKPSKDNAANYYSGLQINIAPDTEKVSITANGPLSLNIGQPCNVTYRLFIANQVTSDGYAVTRYAIGDVTLVGTFIRSFAP